MEPSDSGGGDTDSDADADADTDATGTVSVTVFYGDAGIIAACGPDTDGVLEASFDDALGNVAGRVRCSGPSGELLLQFTNGHLGAWTDTTDGVSFLWADPWGGTLAYSTAGRTAWAASFDTVERLDTQTLRLVAALSGEWSDTRLNATVDVTMGCTNCP